MTLPGRETAPPPKGVRETARKTTTSTEVKRRYNNRVYSKIQAELPKETVEAFRAKCKQTGVSQASVILESIENFLREP